MEIAVLALGCFWGPEIKFAKLDGVTNTEVGYCGGNSNNTNYEQVCSGKTNHAEVVKIEFDNTKISYEKILDFFFEIHDPTTLNRQGPDIGTQYRSVIFYFSDYQRKISNESMLEYEKNNNSNVVTQISEATKYYKAEEYHQKYIQKTGLYCAS